MLVVRLLSMVPKGSTELCKKLVLAVKQHHWSGMRWRSLCHPWINHNLLRKGMFCSRHSVRQETLSPGSYSLLCHCLTCDPGKAVLHLFTAIFSVARWSYSSLSHMQGYTWNSSNGFNNHLYCGQFWRNIRDSSITWGVLGIVMPSYETNNIQVTRQTSKAFRSQMSFPY